MDTSREVMEQLLRNGRLERVGLREVNIWPETIQAWVQQGYPTERLVQQDGRTKEVPVDWPEHFNYDLAAAVPGFDIYPLPHYREVLEETDEWVIWRNGGGATFKNWKHKCGTPEHVDFRMTSREVWECDYRPLVLKVGRERLDMERHRKLFKRRRRKGVWTYYQNMFIFETLRQMLGDVCMYQSVLLDPDWIHDYNRVYTDFFKAHFRILIEEIGLPDGIRLMDDLGYNKGLICSPRVLEDLFLPYYKEFVDFIHSYGLLAELHSCGNVTEAVPLVIQAGFDILNPMEVKAGCDIFKFAEDYGDKLAFIGGLDARVLESGDRELMRQEISKLIEGMKARGARYVFGTDHSISPRVKYDDYLYALQVYREHMLY